MKKKLAIVGNKPMESAKYYKFIDSCDEVARINHMVNFGLTGTKTTIYWMEFNGHMAESIDDDFKRRILNIENVYILEHWYNRNFINDSILCSYNHNINIISEEKFSKIKKYFNNTYPFSIYMFIYLLVNDPKYEDYDKFLIGYDVDRYDIDPMSKRTIHYSSKQYAEHFLQTLLDNKQMNYINVNNDTAINANIENILGEHYD